MKCTKCEMTNHTVEKCFEIVGYPSNFKRKIICHSDNTKTFSNNVMNRCAGGSSSAQVYL